MKKITYTKLMQKVEDGTAEIYATETGTNQIILETYDRQGRAKREEVEVTNMPKEDEKYYPPGASEAQVERYYEMQVEDDGDILWA